MPKPKTSAGSRFKWFQVALLFVLQPLAAVSGVNFPGDTLLLHSLTFLLIYFPFRFSTLSWPEEKKNLSPAPDETDQNRHTYRGRHTYSAAARQGGPHPNASLSSNGNGQNQNLFFFPSKAAAAQDVAKSTGIWHRFSTHHLNSDESWWPGRLRTRGDRFRNAKRKISGGFKRKKCARTTDRHSKPRMERGLKR